MESIGGYFCMDSIGGYFSLVGAGRRKWILAACALHWSSHRAKQGKAKPSIWAKQNRQRGKQRWLCPRWWTHPLWKHPNLYNMRARKGQQKRKGWARQKQPNLQRKGKNFLKWETVIQFVRIKEKTSSGNLSQKRQNQQYGMTKSFRPFCTLNKILGYFGHKTRRKRWGWQGVISHRKGQSSSMCLLPCPPYPPERGIGWRKNKPTMSHSDLTGFWCLLSNWITQRNRWKGTIPIIH